MCKICDLVTNKNLPFKAEIVHIPYIYHTFTKMVHIWKIQVLHLPYIYQLHVPAACTNSEQVGLRGCLDEGRSREIMKV